MDTSSDLLTSAEASDLLGVTRRTVQRMADAGTLPIAHKNPGRTGAYLFRRADVEALRESLVATA